MENKHTPTPWKVSQTGKFVMHSRPGTVLNVCEASEEDAALIVRAVNAHDEMLSVLKRIRDHWEGNPTVSQGALLSGLDIPIGYEVVQAIAKAEDK